MILRLFCAVASLNMAQAFMPMFASSSSSTHRQQKQIVLQVGDSYMQYINGRNSLKYFKNRTMFEEQEMELTLEKPVVMIRYSGASGLQPFYLTLAKKIEEKFPNVVVEKQILPNSEEKEATFEVMVDDKILIGNNKDRMSRTGYSRADLGGGKKKIFVSMGELETAIAKAMRKRRPKTVVAAEDAQGRVRLGTLRKRTLERYDQKEEEEEPMF
mmetsp:Transcript_26309/g.40364  ORF Transcript_26309/g.40364 Transcript_26309/m.40364 type:complete len:214 (+) Transcript_26309:212-853(+)